MKKLNIIIASLITVLVSLNFFSCKDKFTEQDAMKLQDQLTKNQKLNDDTIATRKVRVMYTVNLVDASKSTLKSAKAIEAISGALIKLSQNGKIVTKTVDTTGIAVFDSLKTGIATVNVTLAGYSEVNYVLNFSNYVGSGVNGGIQLANIIPMIPITGTSTGTITGTVYCENDLTNRTPETVPDGTKVMAFVSVSSAALPALTSLVTSISYDNLSLETTTTSGVYTLTVPATVLGLDYTIRVTDFTLNQSVLMTTYNGKDTFGVFSIPAFFGSTYTSGSSTVPTGTNSAIITIGPPDYDFAVANATAVASIANTNGVDYAQLSKSGNFYGRGVSETFIDTIRVASPIDPDNRAPITISVNEYGQVYATSITTHGIDYQGGEGEVYTMPYIVKVAKAVVLDTTGSLNGGIVSWQVISGDEGQFYSVDNLEFVKQGDGSSGTGAKLDFPTISKTSGYLYFSTAVQTPATPLGSNYWPGDTFLLAVKTVPANMNDPMTCVLHMQTGIVTAISVTNGGSNYISGKVKVIISAPDDLAGTTALASATVTNKRISSIDLSNNGTGYSTAPTVTIINQVARVQAKATANITSGKITSITLNAGDGYLTPPAVTITPTVSGLGSGATAIATVSNGTPAITLINGGSNYIGVNYPASAQNADSKSVTVKGSGTSIINVNLGTGKRTIEQ